MWKNVSYETKRFVFAITIFICLIIRNVISGPYDMHEWYFVCSVAGLLTCGIVFGFYIMGFERGKLNNNKNTDSDK
jgi:hypothetical protein